MRAHLLRLHFRCLMLAARFDGPGYPTLARALDTFAGWLVRAARAV